MPDDLQTKRSEHTAIINAYSGNLSETETKDTDLCNTILTFISASNPPEKGFRYFIDHVYDSTDCSCMIFCHTERRERFISFFTTRGYKMSYRTCYSSFMYLNECCGDIYISWNPGYQGDFYTDGIPNPVMNVVPDPPLPPEPEPPVIYGP